MSERAAKSQIKVGARVRVTGSAPWHKRVGCEGTVVAPPTDGTYPQPAKGEVLLLLDDDPLDELRYYTGGVRLWTCVLDAKDVEVLDA